MNDFGRLKDILSSLIKIYKELLNTVKQERKYLIDIDTENLIKIAELKQYISLEIKKSEDELKDILMKYNVENINEFLFFESKNNNVENIRILNGNLHELLEQYTKEYEINRMITQESISFYNNIMSLYMSFMRNQNENYNRDATVNITQQSMSIKV